MSGGGGGTRRGRGFSNANVLLSPSVITGINAWYAQDGVRPWLSFESDIVRMSFASDHDSTNIDDLRAVLLAGLEALDKLAAMQRSGSEAIDAYATWPPEQTEAGEPR